VTVCSLLISARAGRCDDTYSMAPPVSATSSPPSSSVFNWQEIPVNQQVPITRAVFDEGGYQLYDTVGETIIVPFKSDNLYVMKFGVSDTGSTFFVNTGSTPILFVPRHGYLTNGAVPGARWYPFTSDFAPETPVFLGVAPSWSIFIGTGWYPNMFCYGGYWCGTEFGYFTPAFGLFISFGGHDFGGWGAYRGYAGHYAPPYHLGYYHPGVYHYGARSYWAGRSFHGSSGNAFGGGSHGFAGASGHGSAAATHGFAGAAGHGVSGGTHSFSGSSGHVFRGAEGGHSYSGGAHSRSAGFRGNEAESHGGVSGGGFRGAEGGSHGGGFGGQTGGGSHGGGFSGGGDHGGDSGGNHGGGDRHH